MIDLQANPIFNPKWDDTIDGRTIIKGNTTGLFNLNSVKYTWAKSMYQVMIGNFLGAWKSKRTWWWCSTV